MSAPNPSSPKELAFSAVSNVALEHVQWPDGLALAGLVNLLEEGPENLGGLAIHGIRGVRSLT